MADMPFDPDADGWPVDDSGPEQRMHREKKNLFVPESKDLKSRCLLCNMKQKLYADDGVLYGKCPNKKCGYQEYLGGSSSLLAPI